MEHLTHHSETTDVAKPALAHLPSDQTSDKRNHAAMIPLSSPDDTANATMSLPTDSTVPVDFAVFAKSLCHNMAEMQQDLSNVKEELKTTTEELQATKTELRQMLSESDQRALAREAELKQCNCSLLASKVKALEARLHENSENPPNIQVCGPEDLELFRVKADFDKQLISLSEKIRDLGENQASKATASADDIKMLKQQVQAVITTVNQKLHASDFEEWACDVKVWQGQIDGLWNTKPWAKTTYSLEKKIEWLEKCDADVYNAALREKDEYDEFKASVETRLTNLTDKLNFKVASVCVEIKGIKDILYDLQSQIDKPFSNVPAKPHTLLITDATFKEQLKEMVEVSIQETEGRQTSVSELQCDIQETMDRLEKAERSVKAHYDEYENAVKFIFAEGDYCNQQHVEQRCQLKSMADDIKKLSRVNGEGASEIQIKKLQAILTPRICYEMIKQAPMDVEAVETHVRKLFDRWLAEARDQKRESLQSDVASMVRETLAKTADGPINQERFERQVRSIFDKLLAQDSEKNHENHYAKMASRIHDELKTKMAREPADTKLRFEEIARELFDQWLADDGDADEDAVNSQSIETLRDDVGVTKRQVDILREHYQFYGRLQPTFEQLSALQVRTEEYEAKITSLRNDTSTAIETLRHDLQEQIDELSADSARPNEMSDELRSKMDTLDEAQSKLSERVNALEDLARRVGDETVAKFAKLSDELECQMKAMDGLWNETLDKKLDMIESTFHNKLGFAGEMASLRSELEAKMDKVCESCTDTWAAMESRANTLRDHAEKCMAISGSYDASAKSLAADLKDLSAIVADTSLTVTHLAGRLSRQDIAVNETKHEVANLWTEQESDRVNMGTKILELYEQREKCRSRCEDGHKFMMEQLGRDNEATKQQCKDQTAFFKGRMQELKTIMSTTLSQVHHQGTAIGKVFSRIEDDGTAIPAMQTAITELQAQVQAQDSTLTKANERVQAQETATAKTHSEVREQEIAMAEMQTRVQELHTALTKTDRHAIDQDSAIAKLYNRVQVQYDVTDSLKENVARHDTKLDDNESRLADHEYTQLKLEESQDDFFAALKRQLDDANKSSSARMQKLGEQFRQLEADNMVRDVERAKKAEAMGLVVGKQVGRLEGLAGRVGILEERARREQEEREKRMEEEKKKRDEEEKVIEGYDVVGHGDDFDQGE